MRVRVSKTVKAAFGRKWKKEVTYLIEAAVLAWDDSEGKATSFISPAQMSIRIKVNKKGATVTARPDFLPKLDECEIQLPLS